MRRMKDVGRSKAEVAARRVMERISGVTVTPHHCRIEEKALDFYEQFHILVLGLDSLEARRFMNQVACSFLGARQLATPLWDLCAAGVSVQMTCLWLLLPSSGGNCHGSYGLHVLPVDCCTLMVTSSCLRALLSQTHQSATPIEQPSLDTGRRMEC